MRRGSQIALAVGAALVLGGGATARAQTAPMEGQMPMAPYGGAASGQMAPMGGRIVPPDVKKEMSLADASLLQAEDNARALFAIAQYPATATDRALYEEAAFELHRQIDAAWARLNRAREELAAQAPGMAENQFMEMDRALSQARADTRAIEDAVRNNDRMAILRNTTDVLGSLGAARTSFRMLAGQLDVATLGEIGPAERAPVRGVSPPMQYPAQQYPSQQQYPVQPTTPQMQQPQQQMNPYGQPGY